MTGLSEAAAEMARRRLSKMTKKEKSEHAKKMAEASWDGRRGKGRSRRRKTTTS